MIRAKISCRKQLAVYIYTRVDPYLLQIYTILAIRLNGGNEMVCIYRE